MGCGASSDQIAPVNLHGLGMYGDSELSYEAEYPCVVRSSELKRRPPLLLCIWDLDDTLMLWDSLRHTNPVLFDRVFKLNREIQNRHLFRAEVRDIQLSAQLSAHSILFYKHGLKRVLSDASYGDASFGGTTTIGSPMSARSDEGSSMARSRRMSAWARSPTLVAMDDPLTLSPRLASKPERRGSFGEVDDTFLSPAARPGRGKLQGGRDVDMRHSSPVARPLLPLDASLDHDAAIARYKEMASVFSTQTAASLLPADLCAELDNCILALEAMEKPARLQTSKRCLEALRCYGTPQHGTFKDSERVQHVVVTASLLLPAYAKMILFGLNRFFHPGDVYSVWMQEKSYAFKSLMQQYRVPKSRTYAIGDGSNEHASAVQLGINFLHTGHATDVDRVRRVLLRKISELNNEVTEGGASGSTPS